MTWGKKSLAPDFNPFSSLSTIDQEDEVLSDDDLIQNADDENVEKEVEKEEEEELSVKERGMVVEMVTVDAECLPLCQEVDDFSLDLRPPKTRYKFIKRTVSMTIDEDDIESFLDIDALERIISHEIRKKESL